MPWKLTILVLLFPLVSATASVPLTVGGTVADAEGSPLAGAAVELVAVDSNFDNERRRLERRPAAEPLSATRSDAEGRFELRTPGAGLFRLRVRARHHVPMRYPLLPLAQSAELPPLRLARDAGSRLTVVDGAGKRLAGAAIWAASAAPEIWESLNNGGWQPGRRLGWSDTEGRITVARAPGEQLSLLVWGPGSMSPRRTTAVRGTTVTLPAAGGGPRRILEVHDARGEPLSGVLVAVGRRVWPLGESGADGRLELHGGSGTLRVHALDADGRFSSTRLVDGDASRTVLLLPDLTLVAGRIRTASSSAPVAGALVWSHEDPGRFTTSDAAGRYVLRVPSGRRLRLRAAAEGFLATEGSADAPISGSFDLSLEPAVALRGQVVDEAGSPLADVHLDARVEDGGRHGGGQGAAAGHAATGADGRFQVAGLPGAESYLVTASRPGYATAEVRSTAGHPPEVRLVLKRGRRAHGRVTDLEERPVEGAEVWLTAAGSRGIDDGVRAVSDREGRFEVPQVPARKVDILARGPGHAPLSVPGVELPAGRRPADLGTLMLAPGVTLEGEVRDAELGPLSAAEVELRPSSGPTALAPRFAADSEPDATTGEDGRFAVHDLSPSTRVDLRITCPGYLAASVSAVEVPPAEPLTVVLRPAATVRGQVENAVGEPLARAVIRARPSTPAGAGELSAGEPAAAGASATSDEQGAFLLVDLAPGRWQVDAFVDGYQPSAPVEVELRGRQELTGLRFVLERGAVLAGQVSDLDGERVAGARVSIGRASATTDAEGSFQVAGVVPGRREVEVRHPAYNRLRRELDVEPGWNRADFELAGGYPVSGWILDSAGLPVTGADVTLEGPAGVYHAASDAEDGFRFSAVADGEYRLWARKKGYAGGELSESVRVGGAAVADLELWLESGITVDGRILGLELDELAVVHVEAEHLAGGVQRAGTVDYKGRYEVTDLGPGDWRLNASLPDGSRQVEARLSLAAGDTRKSRDLEFGAGFGLRGLVLHGGLPLADARVSLRGFDVVAERSVTTDFSGTFAVADLRPGAYRLSVLSPRLRMVHNRDLELLAEHEMVIDVATVLVDGTVVSAATGKPVANAVVYLRQQLAGGDLGSLYGTATDASGAFRVEHLTAGRYQVRVQGAGHEALEQNLEVDSGAAVDLRLVLTPALSLEVAARLSSGAVPRLLTLVAFDSAGVRRVAETRGLDASGRGRFPTLPAGTWDLLVSAPESGVVAATANVPGEPLALVLPAAGRLRVRVPALLESHRPASLTLTSHDGFPYARLETGGELRREWQVVGGWATVEAVPAGLWTLRAVAPDGGSWVATVATTGGPEIVTSLE